MHLTIRLSDDLANLLRWLGPETRGGPAILKGLAQV